MNREPFVIEQVYEASAEQVWQAITDPEKMKEWYFDIPGFKAEPGFEFDFEGGAEDRVYVHLCKVMEAVPNKKLKHSWSYKGWPGISYVTWELFTEGDKTRVRLTHQGLETFGTENADFAATNFAQGWTEITGTSLKSFLERQ